MSSKEIFIGSIILSAALLLFSLVKDKKSFVIRTLFRGIMSVFLIYIVNAIFAGVKIPLSLGVNIYSVCTTALLGIPGLTMLYGILGCQIL